MQPFRGEPAITQPDGDSTMRFMMLLRADSRTEAGVLPTEQDLATMAKYNEELVKAGVLLAGEGLKPTSQGARVTFSGGKVKVTDGPFTETKELIAGYWMIQVKSKEEAVEWAKRVPFHMVPQVDGEAQIELRQVYELEDFAQGEALQKHARLQEQIAKQKA
jgi:hypothetical protein